jgi:hypothetical protein
MLELNFSRRIVAATNDADADQSEHTFLVHPLGRFDFELFMSTNCILTITQNYMCALV